MVKAGENSPASFIFLVYSYDGINVKKQFFTLTNQISEGDFRMFFVKIAPAFRRCAP